MFFVPTVGRFGFESSCLQAIQAMFGKHCLVVYTLQPTRFLIYRGFFSLAIVPAERNLTVASSGGEFNL